MLAAHVGRVLLGFTEKPDRRKYLQEAKPPKPPETIIAAYEKLVAEAQGRSPEKQKDAFSSNYSPIGQHFERYANALVQCGQCSKIVGLIRLLRPNWDDPSGNSKLGEAAFRCGEFTLAEEFLVKCRGEITRYERGKTMGYLAEIWQRSGKREEAKDLLLDCLGRLLEESKSATGSDISLFEEWFQNHMTTLRTLYPEESEALLKGRAIPPSTLRRQGA